MRAIRLTGSAESPARPADDLPQPQPGRGELLIQVYAAGVTPTEVLWYPTSHDKNGGERSGAVPGHEFSGVIAAVGEEVTGFAAGQSVYGMNDWFADGALAEYCITQPSWVAPKPPRLSHAEAASVPIGALTAWQGLYDRAKLQTGESVLIHGGAGAVGVFAIQLARLRGARVMTTVSARNRDFVLQLGAGQAIDYRATRFEESVPKVAVVFDTAGGETLQRSWSVLKPGGRLVTIAVDARESADSVAKEAFFIVEADAKQLAAVGNLLQAGDLRPVVDVVLPLAEAPAAFAGTAANRAGRGKIVVAVAEQASTAAPRAPQERQAV